MEYTQEELEKALQVVNTQLRGEYDSPIICMVKCPDCGKSIFITSANHGRNEISEYAARCAPCTISYRKKKKRECKQYDQVAAQLRATARNRAIARKGKI